MKTSDFNYYLPEELIAQTPLHKRQDSRMLVCDRESKEISHRHFYDILDYLRAGDVLVVNSTRVLPAKLNGIAKGTKEVEVLLHKRLDDDQWEILIKNAKRYKAGDEVVFSDSLKGVFVEGRHNENRIMKFLYNGVFEEVIAQIGSMPLPHYIKPTLTDNDRYQTVYHTDKGDSVAAPTAGLHFSPELIEKVKSKGIQWVEVNLDVGLGTFRPVKTDDLTVHKMHSESFELTPESAKLINDAKLQGRRIVAVGTTSVRVIESCADDSGKVTAKKGNTEIFIYPPYKFKCVDALITNFHLPQSTLIMLVSAFMGQTETMNAYNIAVKEKYRFFSFGDCMLIV